ncbi:UvrD-helicase domain-containing protein [Kocuria turfanensis]|uniref:UvrD-helicase domain-containing protein n=1 Tax=Kocuria turfanensis TaxID=388357 RepID=UPI0040370E9F
MNGTQHQLADEPAREAIRHDLDRSVFVEAGAGSGKTREMVQRVVALVDRGTSITAVVAITFTEKAAAELRERIRAELGTDAPDDAARARRAEARHALDVAPIGTIHSFAGRVVRENPLEAQVPPGIEVLDELQSSLAFEDRWQQIVAALFGKPEHAGAVEVLLAAGMTTTALRDTARAMDQSWDRLPQAGDSSGDGPDEGPWRELTAACEELRGARRGCTDEADGMFTRTALLLEWAGALEERRAKGVRPLLAHLRELPTKGRSRGKKANWTNDITAVKELDERIRELAGELAAAHVRPALELVVGVLVTVLREAAAERRQQGRLEFHDLLVLARDLLVGEEHAAVRQRLHERYDCLMIDEFQDTDPVQAEIALRLASAVSCGPDGWRELPVDGGRLFMVGDPKQSIYRFRRADIETYLSFQERAAADPSSCVATLQTNFRSAAPVLQWVNDVFGALIQVAPGAQPAYVPLVPDPARPEPPGDFGPAVGVLGLTRPPAEDGERLRAEEVREREAQHVAHTVLTALGRTGGTPWQHQPGRTEGFVCRPVTEEDIAILLPTRTSLEVLEKALDDAGIVYRAEASSLVYGATEVQELMLVLEALANSADSGRLVLALRTSILGCGDDELAAWTAGGGTWNYRADAPEGLEDTRVARTLLALRLLARELSRVGVADLMERILEQFLVLEAATDSPRHRETWRRLRFVVDQARAWGTATHGGLRDYLRWAEGQREEGARVKESVVPETDAKAVRITTVHAAKGLEYPVVILAGTGSAPRHSTHHVLFAEDGSLEVALKKELATAGHAALQEREKAMLDAERLRLLYVACTRAQSHLVASLYTASERGEASLAAQLRKVLPPDAHELDFAPIESVRRLAQTVPEERPWDEVLAEWSAVHTAWGETSRIEGSRSVTSVAHAAPPAPSYADGVPVPSPAGTEIAGIADDDAPAGPALPALGEPDRVTPLAGTAPGERSALLHGPEFGTALHQLMELADLTDPESLERLAPTVAQLHGLPGTEALLACARIAWEAGPVRAAAHAEHWRELPVATVEEDGAVLEGVVDLLYREPEGDYVVVDYKTDMALSEVAQDAYWAQLSRYAGQLESLTGGRVRELVLVCCQPTVRQVMTREHAAR